MIYKIPLIYERGFLFIFKLSLTVFELSFMIFKYY